MMIRPYRITQVGIVVEDIRSSIDQYSRVLGFKRWELFERTPPLLHQTTVRGETAEYSFLNAESLDSTVAFELIQPIEGPSIYREWLDEHGDGLHHFNSGMESAAEFDATRASLLAAGAKSLMSGAVGDSMRFEYFEDVGGAGTIAELSFGDGSDAPDEIVEIS